ncbi:hypothetical protein BGW38_002041 [Lunasporangiospora selenospora]|uniref:ABC transporter substrate-binding protein PnrA-like domain-containing protein n=1 Tax=Lunasporangiospora selenospora TaxID=979761 RepID=A0A9P6FUS1_9FUNG|nr:hypothetical protein BGW38_002041 [Lunasporangiospora selenospora]
MHSSALFRVLLSTVWTFGILGPLLIGITSSPWVSASKSTVNMGLVLQGGPDGTKEGTQNALALQGGKEACLSSLLGTEGYQYQSCSLRTYTPADETVGAYLGLIPNKVASENDFALALGYFPSKAIQTAARANGNKLFGIVNFEFLPPEGNIASIMFSEDQIGYLAGLLAGEVAKTRGGKVAVIGGVNQPSVRRHVNGFGTGVQISCSTCTAYGLYSGTFDADPKLSTSAAKVLRSKKVSVVFNAGSIFGTSTLKNLTVTDGIYAIGSGSDEWITNWAYGSVPGSEHVLTSVLTDYRVLVHSVMQSVLHANLTGGATVFYGVNTDQTQSAIKLAPVHEAGKVFNKELEAKMQGYIKDMTTGKLKTGVDHKSGDSRMADNGSNTSVELLSLTDTTGDSNHSSGTNGSSLSEEGGQHQSNPSSSAATRTIEWRKVLMTFAPWMLMIVQAVAHFGSF